MRNLHVLWALVLLLGAASVFALIRVEEVQAHQNDALSAIICHAEHLIRTTSDLNPPQRSRAIRFYQQQIRLEHLKACSDR